MRAYEAVLVLAPHLDEDGVQTFIERAQQALTQKGAQMDRVDRWGKLRLAYEIQHHKEGHYVLLRFSAPPQGGTSELEHLCRISEDVLRHLIVQAVPTSGGRVRPAPAAQEEAPAAAEAATKPTAAAVTTEA